MSLGRAEALVARYRSNPRGIVTELDWDNVPTPCLLVRRDHVAGANGAARRCLLAHFADLDGLAIDQLFPDLREATKTAGDKPRITRLTCRGVDPIRVVLTTSRLSAELVVWSFLPLPEPLEAGCEIAMLTERQREVALLLAEGLSVLNIAARLGLQESTVRTHVKAAYRRLHVTGRTQLVRAVLEGR